MLRGFLKEPFFGTVREMFMLDWLYYVVLSPCCWLFLCFVAVAPNVIGQLGVLLPQKI